MLKCRGGSLTFGFALKRVTLGRSWRQGVWARDDITRQDATDACSSSF
jgi:hypothetical protein